jgi:hypothetical protein
VLKLQVSFLIVVTRKLTNFNPVGRESEAHPAFSIFAFPAYL